MSCPPLETLLLHAEQATDDPVVTEHVSSCASCQGTLDEISQVQALGQELRGSLRDPAMPGAPVLPAIPGYQVEHELHRGGQGIVYRALQESTRRAVAIKLLPRDVFATDRRRHRFEREVELAARLDHPHIVTVHDRGQTPDGHHFFVMKLVDGGPATQFVTRDTSLPEVLELYCKICDAVDFAHQRGVLHRDLKPGNILVERDGSPQVLDFGLAKGMDDESDSGTGLTREGEFLGTLAYASPEHVSGDSSQLNARSDVYSLGVVLHELVTGTFPYAVDGSIASVVRAISEAPRRAPSELGRDTGRRPFDPDLDTIVLRCIAIEPDRRYASAAELARDLRRFLRGEPIAARRDSTWYRLRLGARRHRGLVTASLVMAIVVTALGYALFEQGQTARQQQTAHTHERRLREEHDRFLQGVLRSPDWEKGRIEMMERLLDQAADRIDQDSEADWQTRAQLNRWLGQTYRQLFLADKALARFSLVEQLLDQHPGKATTLWAWTHAELASVHLFRRDRERSRAYLDEVAATLGPDTSRSLRAYFHAKLAHWDYVWGDEESLLENLRIALHAAEPGTRGRALALGMQGLVEWDRGHYDASERALRQARAAWKEFDDIVGGPRHAETLHHLGQTLIEQGKVAEAFEVLDEATRSALSLWGPDAEFTLGCQVLRLSCKAELHGIDTVREQFDDLLERRSILDADPNPTKGRCLVELANLATQIGDLDQAERLYLDAIDHYERAAGSNERLHGITIATVHNLRASVLMRLGRAAEAEEQAHETLAELEGLGSERLVARTHLNLAWLLITQGRGTEALEHAELAYRLHRELPTMPTALADTGLCLGFIQLLGLGKPDAARPILEDAREQIEGAFPADHTYVADVLYLLGWLEFSTGHVDEGGPMLRRALEIREAKLQPLHPFLAWSKNTVCALELHFGNKEEALTLAENALDIARRTPDVDQILLSTSLLNLSRSLVSLGRHEDAILILDERWKLMRRTYGDSNPATQAARAQLREAMRVIDDEPASDSAQGSD